MPQKERRLCMLSFEVWDTVLYAHRLGNNLKKKYNLNVICFTINYKTYKSILI